MRVDEIKRLIQLVEESQIDELEVRRWWSSVRIAKVRAENGRTVVQPVEMRSAIPTPTRAPASAPAPDENAGLVPIVAPMVGSFYASSSPTATPYVEVGGKVEVGRVVCIIEAMKLMNEIESDVAGTIVKVLVENGQPVEYDQPLFMMKPD